MTAREAGFLLLSSTLGDPNRRPLTTAQLRVLADRSWQLDTADLDRDLQIRDLTAIGYGQDAAKRIVDLLEDQELLSYYVSRGQRKGCVPVTRVSGAYPLILRKRLGLDSPGVLWAKGDLSLLRDPMIALVGSRDILTPNRQFAQIAGEEAAKQGFTLVSGNARGSDQTAQEACLRAGGRVIIVVADELEKHPAREGVLYLSEESFDAPFSAQRALSRNRVIHCLGSRVLVAQCSLRTGGTWDGTVKNLRFGWSPVFCFRDDSEAVTQLIQMGAQGIEPVQLSNLAALSCERGFLDT